MTVPKIRLKYVAQIKMGQSPPSKEYTSEENGIAFLQGTAEFGSKYPNPKIFTTDPPKLSREGDILFSVRAPVGALNKSNIVYGIGRGLCAIRANSIHGGYLWWVLHHARKQLISIETGSTYGAVSVEDVCNMVVENPSLTDQKNISGYLDKQIEFNELLIAKKELMISFLREKQESLITQAITRGLNENAKMKESGIHWLGQIHEKWRLTRIKYVTNKVGSGVTPKGGADVYLREGIPFLRSQNIYSDGLRLDDVAYISTEIHESMINSKVQKGDVLLNITGASLGRCYYFDDDYEANVNQHVCILRPNNNILSRYLHYLLISYLGQNQIAINEVGGGREGLNFEDIKAFIIPLPSKDEQAEIVDYLESEIKKIDGLKEATEKSIALLRERRESLISEAVTGQLKIEVR